MGIVRDVLKGSIDLFREEILPLRADLIKAGILTPEKQAYDQKASLVDPWAYGQTSYGYKEKYSLLDYSKCRQITYSDPVVAAVLQTRINQVAAYAQPQTDRYKVGFKIQMRDKKAEASKKSDARAKEIETFIQNCGVPESFEDTPELKKRDNFETFLRKITRDTLTFDQLNFEITPRVDGSPYSFMAVDAATIRVIPDLKERTEQFRGTKGQKYDMTNVNSFGDDKVFKQFEPEHPRYCQVINGVVRHVFDEWEMAFGVRNPRTDIAAFGYGFSEIEMLVTTITSHMNAETYNRKFFSQGSTIKGVISFEGSVPPDQLEAFRRQWYSQVTGVNNAWRTPILALGKESKLNWTSLHANNREMEFGKWMEYCIKTICGVFQMDPIEIGFDISRQGAGQTASTGGLGQGNQGERIAFSQDKGLRPLLVHIQNMLNDYVIHRIDPNYDLEFVGLNANSEEDDLKKSVDMVKSFKTINEVRAEHDLEEIDLESIKKNPGDLILDSSFIQYITGLSQAEQGMEDPSMTGVPDESEGAEEEPDYENMSVEELQSELDKLDNPEGGEPKPNFESAPDKKMSSMSNKKPEAAQSSGKKPAGKMVEGKNAQSNLRQAKANKIPGVVKAFFKELDL